MKRIIAALALVICGNAAADVNRNDPALPVTNQTCVVVDDTAVTAATRILNHEPQDRIEADLIATTRNPRNAPDVRVAAYMTSGSLEHIAKSLKNPKVGTPAKVGEMLRDTCIMFIGQSVYLL